MYQGVGTSFEVMDIHQLSPGDLFLSRGFESKLPAVFVVVDSESSSSTACLEISGDFQVRYIDKSPNSHWPIAKISSNWRFRNPPSGVTSADSNAALTTPGNLVFCGSGLGLTCHNKVKGGFTDALIVWLPSWKLDAASHGNYWISAWSIETQDNQTGEWHKLELPSGE